MGRLVVELGRRIVAGDIVGKSRADKTIAHGGGYLIPKSEWCDLSEIQGCDLDVLYSPTMRRAFERIVDSWKPQHPIALVGLCTATRPYSQSRKWGKYASLFGDKADLIIHSNGGIIPMEYQFQFPYLNYDAHGEKKYDKDYIKIGIERMRTFFTAHRYSHVVFNFRPNMRNYHVAVAVRSLLESQGSVIHILPSAKTYARMESERMIVRAGGFTMYPELYPPLLDELIEKINTLNGNQK